MPILDIDSTQEELVNNFPTGFNIKFWQPSWISNLYHSHKLCREQDNEHSSQVWFQLDKWFQRGNMKCLQTMTYDRHQVVAIAQSY